MGRRAGFAPTSSPTTGMLGLITRFADVRERKTEQGVTELLLTRGAEPTPATR